MRAATHGQGAQGLWGLFQKLSSVFFGPLLKTNGHAVKKTAGKIKPNWHWGTPEGSRDFDRLVDRNMTFRETLAWLKETETLALRMAGEGLRGREGSTGSDGR